MKIPLSWLKEFIDFDLDVETLVDTMGRNGLEVDGVTHPGAGTSGVLTAKVLSWEPHPNADKLRVVQIDNGSAQIEVVCGATNFATGDVVAHAGPGATIPGMTMAAKELRGVLSQGMLCSSRELEVGPDTDGIMLLDRATPLGIEMTDVLPLGEAVIDVEVLADRGDHHSILGIAREIAAVLDLELRRPASPRTELSGPVTLRLDEPEACTQFATRTVGGVAMGASSWPLRMRLAQCGVRSISNVVDVTNYVMLELGQPMHAYDLDKLEGSALGVRFARQAETLVTLDDQERTLDPRDLLVIDGQRPVGLAGVMGGLDTEVTSATSRVTFEAATWNAPMVRATSLRLGLNSEAGMRFARGVDPAGARAACDRAVELLGMLAGGLQDLGANHAGSDTAERESVAVQPSWVRSFIGLDALTDNRQRELLERAGCVVVAGDDQLVVT
ncbi:MAG: phenylalanyl-tRNA synthetase beta chain, partial [Glaciecola sp.]